MHGSRPLPDATHKFPAKPDLAKFWKTPLSKSYFKALGCYMTFAMSFVAFNFYISKFQKGDFDLEVVRPQAQYEAILAAREKAFEIEQLHLNIHIRAADLTGGYDPRKPEMIFDDGIDLVAAPQPFINHLNHSQ